VGPKKGLTPGPLGARALGVKKPTQWDNLGNGFKKIKSKELILMLGPALKPSGWFPGPTQRVQKPFKFKVNFKDPQL